MTNPVLCIRKQLPNGKVSNEQVVMDLTIDQMETGKRLGFIVGYAEGLLTFMQGETIPVHVENYDELNEYEKMRIREYLVVMSTVYGGYHVSPNTALKIKVKLELDKYPPQALIYAIGDVIKES